VHNDGPIPPRKAIEIIADACQALNFSHQHGIIHRDVKPANIMISRTGAVKVMDFGIARALADSNSVTQTAAVIGTAQYLSPEQARGDSVDARSDVYSLGCVLYEILTGEPPFVGDSPVAVAYQHVREAPIPPSQKNPEISADLDAVVLKALAKNPENRYQSAAEMRADLVRVHNGEPPEAPKVLTDAERTSLLSATPTHRSPPSNELTSRRPTYIPGERHGRASVTRWLVIVAVLAVLTVLVTWAINVLGGNTHKVQVPDVTRKSQADATAILQNSGFEARTQPVTDPSVPPDQVVATDPRAGENIDNGSVVTLKVSVGPEQRQVPDVSNMSFADASRKLAAAGFGKIKQVPTPSTPEQKDHVVGTNPPANSTAPVTFEIQVLIGNGPESVPVPDVTGQAPDQARATLTAAGFTNIIDAQVDSPKTAGAVIGTSPPAGPPVPKDTLIQLQISKGNQFVMPNVVGQFYADIEPMLRSLGWTGTCACSIVQNTGQRSAAVVTQNPPAGAGVNKDASITLAFAS
jgi:beta-lactam-binding protein with PASTA domain